MDLVDKLSEIRRYQSFIGRHLGPYCLLNELEKMVQSAWSPIVIDAIASAKVLTANGTMTIEALTAEHAILILKSIQITSGASTHDESGAKPGPGLLLFRGMRDAQWELLSSMSRQLQADQPAARHLTQAFTKLVQELGHHMIQVQLPDSTYESVAQHYGFATHLMDFTPDPEVAVFFATQRGSTSQAVVYFDFVRSLQNDGCKVLLPPPMYDRLLLQRGVFVESESAIPAHRFHRIVFPSGQVPRVYREGRAVDLLAEPRWISRARNFVESWAPGQDLDNVQSVYHAWFDADQAFHMSDAAPRFSSMHEYLRWLDYYEDMRYWLASTMSGEKEGFWMDTIEAIDRANPELVQLHRQLMEAMGKSF